MNSQHWQPTLVALADQRRGRLIAFATMLAGPGLAEDLVQDAVVATFASRRSFDSVQHAERYVRRAIASRFVDHIRKESARTAREQRVAPLDSLPDHSDASFGDPAVAAALAGLPPRVRACIALRFLEDLSIRETAVLLKLSEGAVKRYVSEGLTQLNAQLGTHTSIDSSAHVPVEAPRGGSR